MTMLVIMHLIIKKIMMMIDDDDDDDDDYDYDYDYDDDEVVGRFCRVIQSQLLLLYKSSFDTITTSTTALIHYRYIKVVVVRYIIALSHLDLKYAI